MDEFRGVSLTVNGFPVEAVFSVRQTETVFRPLLRQWAEGANRAHRKIVLIAAPPGAGKSTLAAYFEALGREMFPEGTVRALGMDGFHYPQAVLESRFTERDGQRIPLAAVKGAPETFDLAGLSETLARLTAGEDVDWPVYDRRLHDVAPERLHVTEPVLLVEGNWLLLNAPGWRTLPRTASLFVTEDPETLKKRLIARKIRGGKSPEAAAAFYESSDRPNAETALTRSLPADRTIRILHPENDVG